MEDLNLEEIDERYSKFLETCIGETSRQQAEYFISELLIELGLYRLNDTYNRIIDQTEEVEYIEEIIEEFEDEC